MMTIDDPYAALRQISAMLREETRATRRRTARMLAEQFQREEIGLSTPREREGDHA